MEEDASRRGETNFQHSARNRRFYTLPTGTCDQRELPLETKLKNSATLLHTISESIIGKDKVFNGPFGPRRVLYLDYIASGRSLSFIEDYIREKVLPEYGNTHTTTSVTSLQTTLFRHEARDIVRNAVNASEHDAVLFVGSGCTGAIHKLLHGLDLNQPPVVFIGPFEHHSNLLPWRELGAQVIQIAEDESGLVDIGHLTMELKKWQKSGRQLIGCFSAASNITGLLTDVNAVTICLHKHEALAFWDFATSGPYVKVDMNPVITSEDQPLVYKDAIFLSVHKFVGGVSTPGLLVAKKKLFLSESPECCGGGSVFYVSKEGHRFLQEPELREEAGTPPIVESIRAGLVFQLKEAVGHEVIMEREQYLLQRAMVEWKDCPGLVILGNESTNRLPVFSFLIHHGNSGMFLHHNYVSALLNDVFGIQARGGCACAGPYAQSLLGMSEDLAQRYENLLSEDRRLDRTHLRRYTEYSDREILRPGFTRFNLPYFMMEEELGFVIEAIKMVASDGWRLLPMYMFNPQTGEWRARHHQIFKDRKWLGHISYSSGEMKYKDPFKMKGNLPENFKDCLMIARELFSKAQKTSPDLPDHTVMFDEGAKPFRWFLLPSEVLRCLRGQAAADLATQGHRNPLPFCPQKLLQKLGLDNERRIADLSSSVETEKVPDCEEKAGGHYNSRIVDESDEIAVQFNTTRKTDQQIELRTLPFEKGSNVCCQSQNQSQKGLHGHVGELNRKSSESRTIMNNTCSDSDIRDTSFSVGMAQILEEGYACGTGISEKSHLAILLANSDDVDHTSNLTDGNGDQGPASPENDVDLELESNTVRTVDSGCSGKSLNDSAPSCDKSPGLLSVTSTTPSERPADVNVLQAHNVIESGTESVTMSKMESSKVVSRTEPCRTAMCSLLNKEDVKQKTEFTTTKLKWHSPWKKIFKPFVEAVEEYGMFKNGDRVLVCLSGGKDSLSLLHTVRQYQFYSRSKGIKFEFGAVTVDPQTPSYDPSPLKDYLAVLGVPYFYESQGIMESAAELAYECASICSFCSRMKRGRIYACARREGYNVLALGQHLDDLSESFLMSFFHNGILRTMKACYSVQEGDLRVIRPFVYVREKDLREFAEQNKLPVIAENCPACFEAPKERHRIKQMLASQEILHPRVYSSMMSAMKPIMAINKTGVNIHKLLQAPQEEQPNDDLDL